MKKISLSVFFLVAAFTFAGQANACAGKTLYIGIHNTPDEHLLAEVLSVLINERTGTTVNIRTFDDTKEMYQAVKKGEVGILIENTDRALNVLGKPEEKNAKRAYEISKEEFKKSLSLVWLEPFGLFSQTGQKSLTYCGALITTDVLNNFPALPRVINKLSGALNDDAYQKLIKSLNTGGKARSVARDFLKSKKLI